MTLADAALLAAAATGAGVVNAIAGGGTLLTFPALQGGARPAGRKRLLDAGAKGARGGAKPVHRDGGGARGARPAGRSVGRGAAPKGHGGGKPGGTSGGGKQDGKSGHGGKGGKGGRPGGGKGGGGGGRGGGRGRR